MSLTLSDVQRIANLAKLELDNTHIDKTLSQLNAIFDLAEQMKAIDTKGVLPLNHPTAAVAGASALRLREDVVTENNLREQYQQCAPQTEDGLYLVPKVIE